MLDLAYINSNAAECVRMAGEADSARQRSVLFGMAQAWAALSAQASAVGAHAPQTSAAARPDRQRGRKTGPTL